MAFWQLRMADKLPGGAKLPSQSLSEKCIGLFSFDNHRTTEDIGMVDNFAKSSETLEKLTEQKQKWDCFRCIYNRTLSTTLRIVAQMRKCIPNQVTGPVANSDRSICRLWYSGTIVLTPNGISISVLTSTPQFGHRTVLQG